MFLLVPSFLLFTFIHKNDSVNYHVKKGEKDKAFTILNKMYPTETIYVRNLMYQSLDKALN